MNRIYFFGCVGDVGHYLYRAENQLVKRGFCGWNWPSDWPWHGTGALDGSFAPDDEKQRLGRAKLTRHQGWTILAMWDRSVDRRFNSNAAFVARGEHDFAGMLQLAREHFPAVLARIEAQAPLAEVPS